MTGGGHEHASEGARCVCADEGRTEVLGALIGRGLQGGDVVALEGELGAGKTRLVRGIAAGLELDPGDVSSPTYVLVQEYGPSPAGLTLAHADAYRLDAATASLESIGWDDFLAAPDVVTVIEWASRVVELLPPGTVRIDIMPDEHVGSDGGPPSGGRSMREPGVESRDDVGADADPGGPGSRRVIEIRPDEGAATQRVLACVRRDWPEDVAPSSSVGTP